MTAMIPVKMFIRIRKEYKVRRTTPTRVFVKAALLHDVTRLVRAPHWLNNVATVILCLCDYLFRSRDKYNPY